MSVSNIVAPTQKQGLCGALVHLSSRGASLEAKACPGYWRLRLSETGGGGHSRWRFFVATGGRRLVPKAPFLPTEHEEELLTFLHVCQLKPQM